MAIWQKIAASPDEGPGQTKDCPSCDDGDCKTCDGSGATGPNSNIPCPICSSGVLGQCPTCHGTGKVHV